MLCPFRAQWAGEKAGLRPINAKAKYTPFYGTAKHNSVFVGQNG